MNYYFYSYKLLRILERQKIYLDGKNKIHCSILLFDSLTTGYNG